jgi:RNA polymerase sigma-70 factor (ECF subfamily)
VTDEDKQLARRVRKGDEKAFRSFFEFYYPRIYRFCARRLDPQEAEDAAQQVMVLGVRKIGTYRGEAALLTWLTQIARNEIKAHYRSRARHSQLVAIEDSQTFRAEVESLPADPLLNPETAAQHGQRQQLVQLILDHLPGQYGSVLEWKYIEGLSVEEIAGRLETTAVAVQSMLARARKAFLEQYSAMTEEVQQLIGTLPGGGNG